MQQGRGGMGSHKHGIHGHSGPSPRTKFMRSFDANREADEARLRKPKRRMFATLAELMKLTRR